MAKPKNADAAKSLTAWSFSRLAVFRECRRQFKYKFIDKLPEQKGPALVRGDSVHKGIAKYLEGRSKVLPADGTNYGPLAAFYAAVRKQKPAVEMQVAVDRDWRRVDWFDRSAWLRVIFDVAFERKARTVKGKAVVMGDHKTGRVHPAKHGEQLEVYACVGPSLWPDAAEYHGEMYYVDHAMEPTEAVFLAKDIPKLRKKWEKAAAPIFKATQYPAEPGQGCRWCAFSGRRGGPCDAG